MSRVIHLALVSASPRRAELIRSFDIDLEIVPVDADETEPPGLGPGEVVETLARRKVDRFLETSDGSEFTHILGADTLVFVDGRALGKAADEQEAVRNLRALSGKVHEVRTGICLFCPRENLWLVDSATTRVEVASLDDRDLSWYVGTGEWKGVAGSYRLQGLGSVLAERIMGDHSNVVGLPMRLFYGMVLRSGYLFPGQ